MTNDDTGYESALWHTSATAYDYDDVQTFNLAAWAEVTEDEDAQQYID